MIAKRLLNSIARCYVCSGAMTFWNKGGKREARYYRSTRMHKGSAGCTNGVGVPAEALDEAVNEKLYHVLNDDIDMLVDLCEGQAKVIRANRAAVTVSEREKLEAGSKAPSVTCSIRSRPGRQSAVG